MTREEAIKRLETVRDQSNQAVFTITAVVRDWENYGKSRTYVEVAVYTNAWNRKRTEKIGYVDNMTGNFVAA